MRLENLYQDFSSDTIPNQLAYVVEYRLRRAADMLKTPTWPKPKKVSKSKAKHPPLTADEKTLMSIMGYKKKDMIALRELKNV